MKFTDGSQIKKQVVETIEAENIPEKLIDDLYNFFNGPGYKETTREEIKEFMLLMRKKLEISQKETEGKLIKMNQAPEGSEKEVMDLK